MGREIERKYLVIGNGYKQEAKSYAIRQGYITANPQKPVRVRMIDNKAWLNIKARMEGLQRYEFEYAIPAEDAAVMLDNLCELPLIEKTRYIVEYQGKIWEIDEFEGANYGLVVAEVELDEADEIIAKPGWLGKEVTHDKRYYNAWLAKNPYSNWEDREQYLID